MSAPNFSNFNYSGTFEVQECEILTHSNIRVPFDGAFSRGKYTRRHHWRFHKW